MDFSFLSDYFRYNTHGILNIATGVFDISLGLLVFFSNPQSKTNRAYFLMAVTTFFWVCGFGMESLVRNEADAYFWHKVAYFAGVPFITPSFYWLSSALRNRHDNRRKILIGYILAAIAMIPMIVFTENIIRYHKHPWGRLSLSKKHGRVICQTKDSGGGLPPSELERIYERFY